MASAAGEIGKDISAGYKAIPRPYKVVFGIETGINTAAESIPYVTGDKEVNGSNLLWSGGKIIGDATYSAATYKAGDALGFSLDVAKGLVNEKSFGEAMTDSTISLGLSKSADRFIKDENIKRIVVGVSNKGVEALKEFTFPKAENKDSK